LTRLGLTEHPHLPLSLVEDGEVNDELAVVFRPSLALALLLEDSEDGHHLGQMLLEFRSNLVLHIMTDGFLSPAFVLEVDGEGEFV